MKLDREFWKKLKSLVFPIAFQQVMLALVSATDAVMLGMLSQDAMSAVSLAGQVQFVFSLYLATMTIGTSMFAAQYWGKRDVDTVERLLGMVLLFTLPAGLLMPTIVLGGAFAAIFLAYTVIGAVVVLIRLNSGKFKR